ncbi:MAG: type I DNA topoisomerase [Planctomycetaceae bacterium]|nr:type I DNA topoisomerase [Planctomycetaceae bacterium]
MVNKTSQKQGRSLVIVESPAKARTIGSFLGKSFSVEASIGHVRDLPKSAKEIPEAFKKESWARLGVNVDSEFEPIYVVSDDKKKQIKKIKDLLKESDAVYLATDEDREGEAISWHLLEVLKPKVPVYRLVFHEITKSAIDQALSSPRQIDEDLVRAQETRRIIDRLYGYEVSPLLWYKVAPKLSAGRVQSVAVRMIVQRERERIAFQSATYWDLLGYFSPENGRPLTTTLVSVAGKKIPEGKDFNPNSGLLFKPENFLLLSESGANALRERLLSGQARVANVEEKPYTARPYAPFTTSTLQQEANRKFGFTARTTMGLAQSLYENGHITYMRTDSTNLSKEAINAARNLVASQYGQEYLPDAPRYYSTKVKNAQEAHEAIRPAGNTFRLPEQLRGKLSYDEFRLFDLIWKRTVASQMKDANGFRTKIEVALDDAIFEVSGKTISFSGYLRAYVEGSDDPDAELADQEVVLPKLAVGQTLKTNELEPKSHATKPPARYTEAALTKALEEKGIGRPSTYASIIETILNRNYGFKKSGALVPTWIAFSVSQLLEKHLPDLVDYEFTAQMEDQLDAISRGELQYLHYLRDFYFGEEQRIGLKKQLEKKAETIDAKEINQIELGRPEGSQEPIYVRVGKFGPFLQYGEQRASVPEDLPPDELKIEKAMEILNQTTQAEEPLGYCPNTEKPVFLKVGRFGPYIQRGTSEDEEKPQFASLLKGMEVETLDFETALKLLGLPRTLGTREETNEPVIAHNGRFGPYVQCGKETRSLPAELSPLEVSLEQALELLAKPKQYGRGARGGATAKKAEPLRAFDASPVTEKPVHVLNGRFGIYITDGETNATLPRDLSVEELTFEKALDLLATRAAKGGTKKKATRKKVAAKKVAKKVVKKSTKKAAKKAGKKVAKK